MRDIPGYEGLYALDDDGMVVSVRRGERIAYYTKKTGHRWVRLWKNNKEKHWGLHQLVMLVHVGPCPEGMEVCHWPDPDPTNNRPENLRYGTRSSNVIDEVEAGRHHHSRKTECPSGHEYTPENTYTYYNNGRPSRTCRTCAIDRSRARSKSKRGDDDRS